MSTGKSVTEPFFDRNLTTRQRLTRRRSFVLLVIVGAAAAGWLALMSLPDTPSAEAADFSAPLPVQVVVAESVRSFAQTRHYTGTLVARRASDVSFERSAKVTAVLVDEGDAVKAGEELARLDTRRLDPRHDMLQAQRAAAAAQLAELVAGPRAETIAAARAQVSELQAQLELSERTWKRTSELQSRNSTSEQSVDNARLSMQAARARLARARETLRELVAGTRDEQIGAQQAMVAQLDARLADIELDRQDSVLTAPFTGRVSMRYIDEGVVASPGQPVLKIVETAAIEARIGLPDESIENLQSDDSVAILIGEQTVRARFSRVLPEVDLRTRTQTAVFELTADEAAGVVPGQVARITMNDTVQAEGCWLPTAALSPGQRGLWSVYVVVGREGYETIESRPVEVLHTEGERVLVRGTIQSKDRVVSGGVQRIVPGQRVKVQ